MCVVYVGATKNGVVVLPRVPQNVYVGATKNARPRTASVPHVVTIMITDNITYQSRMLKLLENNQRVFIWPVNAPYLGRRTLPTPEKCVLSDLGLAQAALV